MHSSFGSGVIIRRLFVHVGVNEVAEIFFPGFRLMIDIRMMHLILFNAGLVDQRRGQGLIQLGAPHILMSLCSHSYLVNAFIIDFCSFRGRAA